MTILTIGTLKELIDNLPDDYTVTYKRKTTLAHLEDRVEIDVTAKQLILKS